MPYFDCHLVKPEKYSHSSSSHSKSKKCICSQHQKSSHHVPSAHSKCSFSEYLLCLQPSLSECKGKKEKKKQLNAVTSREIVLGKCIFGCECDRRNGLQDQCPRTKCKGRPECTTVPPTCGPSAFSLNKHMVAYYDKLKEKRDALEKQMKEKVKAGEQKVMEKGIEQYPCYKYDPKEKKSYPISGKTHEKSKSEQKYICIRMKPERTDSSHSRKHHGHKNESMEKMYCPFSGKSYEKPKCDQKYICYTMNPERSDSSHSRKHYKEKLYEEHKQTNAKVFLGPFYLVDYSE